MATLPALDAKRTCSGSIESILYLHENASERRPRRQFQVVADVITLDSIPTFWRSAISPWHLTPVLFWCCFLSRQPRKMRGQYRSPKEKAFISDGQAVWFHVPAEGSSARRRRENRTT